MTRVRERNIDDKVAATIVEVLDGWSGRLTWEALVEAVERREGLRYTRQTLHRQANPAGLYGTKEGAVGPGGDPRDSVAGVAGCPGADSKAGKRKSPPASGEQRTA